MLNSGLFDRRGWRGGCAGWSFMTQRCSTAPRVRRFAAVVATVGLAVLARACGITPQPPFNPRSEYETAGLDLVVLIIGMAVIIGVTARAGLNWSPIHYCRRPADRRP